MGNQVDQQCDENENEWEIINPNPNPSPAPKKLLAIRQSTLNKSIFTVIDYKVETELHNQKPLFNGNYPEATTKKYKISKRIQELQHQIGGETLFGVHRGKGPIQLGHEGTLNTICLENRPVFPKKHQRTTLNLQLSDLD